MTNSIEITPQTLHVDEAILERGRPDLVFLLDCLRRQCEQSPAHFAAKEATYRQAVAEYDSAVKAAGSTGSKQLDAAKQYLATKFSYQPPAPLAIAVHTLVDSAVHDAFRQVRRAAPGLEATWEDSSSGFTTQLRAVHSLCGLAGQQPALRNVLDDAITRAGSGAFRLVDQATQWTDRWTAFRDLLQSSGEDAVRVVLRRAQSEYSPLVAEAHRLEKEAIAAYERLRAATQDPFDLSDKLADLQLTVRADLRQAKRQFETQAYLGLASELAALGGNRLLAGQIGHISDFYAKTEGFLRNMSELSSKGRGFLDSGLMTLATMNYVSLAFSALSMFDKADGPGAVDTNRMILQELAAIRTQLVELGRSIHHRFELVEFHLTTGFNQTLDALAALRVDQQITAANVRALADQIEAVQRQTLGLLDRTAGMLSDLNWTRFIDAAARPEWSDDIARTFDDLVTQIADHSRNRIASSEFDPATANAEMIASFGSLASGRITAQSLGNYRVFAKGNFLRGYFESRHGAILSLPSGSNEVPNLCTWLYGVGLLWKLRERFPQLAGRFSEDQASRVAAALNDVESFWRNLAFVKARGAPSAFTYEGSLFDATVKRISDDLKALQRAVRAARPPFAVVNGGFDCWDASSAAEGAPPAAWFALHQPEIPSRQENAIRLAGYDRSRGAWDQAEQWRAGLPNRISWKDGRFFDYLFLPSERLGHKLNVEDGQLSVRLHAQGWAMMGNRVPGSGLGRMPGTWQTVFALYRGNELLRLLTIERTNETFGELVTSPSSGDGFNAPRYVVNFDDPTATAERLWGEARRCPLASPDSLRALFAKQRESLSSGLWGQAVVKQGDWSFTLQEVTPTLTRLWTPGSNAQATAEDQRAFVEDVVERLNRCNFAILEPIELLRAQFIERLAGDAAIRPLIAQYEEDRAAFLVLLNFAAPQSLTPQVPRYHNVYQMIYVIPGGNDVIDQNMCTSGEDYKGRPFWLDRAAKGIQEEYRQGRFPQSADYVAYVRCFAPPPQLPL